LPSISQQPTAHRVSEQDLLSSYHLRPHYHYPQSLWPLVSAWRRASGPRTGRAGRAAAWLSVPRKAWLLPDGCRLAATKRNEARRDKEHVLDLSVKLSSAAASSAQHKSSIATGRLRVGYHSGQSAHLRVFFFFSYQASCRRKRSRARNRDVRVPCGGTVLQLASVVAAHSKARQPSAQTEITHSIKLPPLRRKQGDYITRPSLYDRARISH
jgi:hypothetical protein